MTKKIDFTGNEQSPVKTKMHIDSSEGKYHIENYQDVSRILERNKIERNAGAYKVKGMQDAKMYKVASLPLIVVQQLAKKGIMTMSGQLQDRERFFKWLNDPDNEKFKIYPKKV